MRILFVDHTAAMGGAQLSLLDIAAARGDDCAVALFESGDFSRRLADAGVDVIPVAAGRALETVKKDTRRPGAGALTATMRAAFALARVAFPYEVLYANSPKSFVVSALAGLMSRKPVIWHLRDILDSAHFSPSNVRVLIRLANALAVRIIVNSAATGDAFVAAGGRRNFVRVVHNGIDAAPFDAVGPDVRGSVRRELGVPPDAFVVGCFSRLHPWKGQRVLLDALEALPGVHALIVGGALFSGEEDYERELAGRSESPALRGRVWLTGARDDVPRLLAACDVVAHTSIWPEPFGRVLVEALLARRPLVASNAGGVPEVVQHGATALLVPPGDAGLLAAEIARLRDDPALAARLADAGAGDVRARFSRTAMLQGVDRVLREVLP